MRNDGGSNLIYLLYASLLFVLTGCGASTLANLAGTGSTPGSVSAKMVYAPSKTATKELVSATAPATVATVQVTVTGTGLTGSAIPVVRGSISTATNQGTIPNIYPGTVTLSIKALDVNNVVRYEGFAIGVVITGGNITTIANPIVMSPPLEKSQDMTCIQCHETTLDVTGQNLVAEFKQSGHYTDLSWTGDPRTDGSVTTVGTGCAGCHGPSHNDPNPATVGRCNACHDATGAVAHNGSADNSTLLTANGFVNNCDKCHNSHTPSLFVGGNCLACHAVPQNANSASFVSDNNGVRSIVGEFSKWSHHVTGVNLNAAHCTACHLEGTIVNGAIAVDSSKHMVDAQTHLRNVDTDADMQWDPAAPNHTTMDNFCLSCHDSNGASSAMSAQIQAYINSNGLAAAGKTASATNPFGDTISNQYDKMQRSAVVDAAGQFATTNSSHHAVMGKRYSGRSRVSKGGTIADATFTSNSSATLPGARSTIFDAGRFTTNYTTLANAGGETGTRNGGSKIGDDSTLHCGDCHTVGQYKANAALNADGTPASAAIGAHGSNNEYLLRNNIGTDQRHIGPQYTSASVVIPTGQPYLICFNCHAFNTYYGANGHASERGGANEDCNGSFNTRAEPNGALSKLVPPTVYTGIGTDRLMSIVTVANNANGTSGVAGGLYGAETTGHAHTMGNIYGIQCANCHNSGVDNGYGGIHGSKSNTYTDGIGNTTKHVRFLPGLDNVMFVPGTKGGYTGGTTATYVNYSGNRNGSGTGATSGQTFSVLPVRNTPYGAGKTGSFNYTTGGITSDLNWEQKTAGLDNGSTSTSQGISGCYTLSNLGVPSVNALQSAGYPANDVRLSPSNGMNAVDGQPVLGNWGGCEDHGGAAARSSEAFTRGIIRPITY